MFVLPGVAAGRRLGVSCALVVLIVVSVLLISPHLLKELRKVIFMFTAKIAENCRLASLAVVYAVGAPSFAPGITNRGIALRSSDRG